MGCIRPSAAIWLTSAAWKMTMSGGVPAATAVGYFWKKRSHGMPCDSKQASGLAFAYCWSISAKTAPSEPVRPCHSIMGSSHLPKALTTGVGSGVGAGGSSRRGGCSRRGWRFGRRRCGGRLSRRRGSRVQQPGRLRRRTCCRP